MACVQCTRRLSVDFSCSHSVSQSISQSRAVILCHVRISSTHLFTRQNRLLLLGNISDIPSLTVTTFNLPQNAVVLLILLIKKESLMSKNEAEPLWSVTNMPFGQSEWTAVFSVTAHTRLTKAQLVCLFSPFEEATRSALMVNGAGGSAVMRHRGPENGHCPFCWPDH